MQITDTPHETTPTLNDLVDKVTKACLDYPERYESIGLYALIMEIIEPALFLKTRLEYIKVKPSYQERLLKVDSPYPVVGRMTPNENAQ